MLASHCGETPSEAVMGSTDFPRITDATSNRL